MLYSIIIITFGLIIPFTMFFFGKGFIKNAPKSINNGYGYRTSMSMKNKDTWEFAHNYSGKLWRNIGIALLSITVIAFAISLFFPEEVSQNILLWTIYIQLFFLIGSIVPTEIKLKKVFDKDGNRK